MRSNTLSLRYDVAAGDKTPKAHLGLYVRALVSHNYRGLTKRWTIGFELERCWIKANMCG
jgi:hypothetical protein